MNGSELRIQLWTLHVAEAGRTWPFLIRIPSQFKAFQVLINCFYGFGFWTFWISSFGFWIRTSCARRMRQRKSNTAGGWLWVLVLNWSPTETIEKKIPAESWVSWPNSTNPKIERRLTNVQGPGLYFRPQSQPLVSVISTISTRDLISTLDFNFQSKYKQFLFFKDVKKFDVNWWFQ